MTDNKNIVGFKADNIIVINGLFVCPFCKKSFKGLAYHTRQAHNISSKNLKEMFGLPYNYSLQTKELKEVRRIRALENNMDLQLIKAGKNTRFKKGCKVESEKIRRGHIKSIRKIVTR